MRLPRAHVLIGLAVACLVTLVLAAHWGCGSFVHALAALALNAFVAAGVGAVLVAALLARALRRRRGRSPGLGRLVASCAVALAMQVALAASYPVGRWLHERDLADAKRWCEAQLEDLERIRQESGEYPEELSTDGDRPRLVRNGDAAYRKLDRAFEFVVLSRARTGRSGEAFTSSERQWRPRSEDGPSLAPPSAGR